MASEKHTTILGAFVLGAIIIFFFMLYFYYVQQAYSITQTYVMLFKGSLTGLQIGAPITFRGVKIGQVIDIRIKRIPETGKIEIPVYVQFYTGKNQDENYNPIYYLIHTGWKADISNPGLISGTSSIILEENPREPVKKFSYYEDRIIFPTIQIPDEGDSLDSTLKTAKKTFNKIADFISSEKLQNTLNNGSAAMEKFNKLMSKLDDQANPILFNFNKALIEMQDTTYQIRNFTEYLSRHPESLITGKKH